MNKNIDAISSETMQALTRHGWPGNIRELQNVIERSIVVYQGGKPLHQEELALSRILSNRTGRPAVP